MTSPLRPASIAAEVEEPYHNRRLTTVNDHEVRLSVMTGPFDWHAHPDSDECFLVVEGHLVIEFETETITLAPGEMLTVPKDTRHRTRPLNHRSVNLTFEKTDAATDFTGEEGFAAASC